MQGMSEGEALNYRRGRSGRPLGRLKKRLRLEGAGICWICGQAINMQLPRNDRWAWTLDHVLPLSTHPHLALDYANAREAHRACNSAKGNRGHANSRTSRDW